CSFRTGLVIPSASRAVTSTGTPGFGVTGSWRTLPIAAGLGGAAGVGPGDRTRAMTRANRTDHAVPIVQPPAELGRARSPTRAGGPNPHLTGAYHPRVPAAGQRGVPPHTFPTPAARPAGGGGRGPDPGRRLARANQ